MTREKVNEIVEIFAGFLALKRTLFTTLKERLNHGAREQGIAQADIDWVIGTLTSRINKAINEFIREAEGGGD